MTSTNSPAENPVSLILKTDSRGRICMPAQGREALLDEFEKSGLSGAKFAALSGIKYSTFACWAQKRRSKRHEPTTPAKPARKAESVARLEAVVQEACEQAGSRNGSLVLHLPGGIRAELATADGVALAAALIRALDKPC